MEIKQILSNLEAGDVFKSWKAKNKSAYVSYIFRTYEDTANENKWCDWQVGYYELNEDKLATFILGKEDNITLQDHEEVFKKPNTKVRELELDKIKIDYKQALDIAKKFQKANYTHEIVGKIICILQNLEDFNNIWNITYMTLAFNTLNIKIDVVTGKVVEHKLTSLMSFAQNNVMDALSKIKKKN